MGKDELLTELDLRQACIHAAGHAMLSRKLGYQSNWWVWADPANDAEQPRWLSRHELIGQVQTAHRALIGLAGVLAVRLAEQREISAAELFESLRRNDIQLTDIDTELTGDFTLEQVAECCQLIQPLLPGIRQEARERPDVATQVKRAKSRQYYA